MGVPSPVSLLDPQTPVKTVLKASGPPSLANETFTSRRIHADAEITTPKHKHTHTHTHTHTRTNKQTNNTKKTLKVRNSDVEVKIVLLWCPLIPFK